MTQALEMVGRCPLVIGDPFVGRAGQLAQLSAALTAALAGQPRAVLIEGEPGIGKSSLLARFCSSAGGALMLRASGDEDEAWLTYGVVAQLVAAARAGCADPARAVTHTAAESADAHAVGAGLVRLLGDLQDAAEVVVIAIDDLHWADSSSARALLFALRRLRADRVLVLLTARSAELSRLGEGWLRFVAGDPQAERIVLPGLSAAELRELGTRLGVGELPGGAVRALLDHTDGNPLHCRALLEELEPEAIANARGGLPAPRALAGVILDRLDSLSAAGRRLVVAAAALGHRCRLVLAAAIAELEDPVPALAELTAAELMSEPPGAGEIRFVHPLVRSAVYEQIAPDVRRQLHRRAAEMVGGDDALRHRVAAAAGPDDRLARDLEAAAARATAEGRLARAGAWLAEASAAAPRARDRDRLVVEAMAALLRCGEVGRAQALAPAVMAAEHSARQAELLGELDVLAGRLLIAEPRLLGAWERHDRIREADIGVDAAMQLSMLCGIAGRIPEAVGWARRAVAADTVAPALRRDGRGLLAIGLCLEGRGREGLAELTFLPAHPAQVAAEDTDALVRRGIARLLVGDLDGAIGDLTVCAARLRVGMPLRHPSLCLGYLAEAEYRRGDWDDAVVHAELAVTLARDADRVWDFGYVHGIAASVPAARGDWAIARAHVQAAVEHAQTLGAADAICAAETARARLGAALNAPEMTLAAAAAARATGRARWCGRPDRYEWRALELDALLAAERLGEAAASLRELEVVVADGDPPCSPSAQLAAARLRGGLAAAEGDLTSAAEAFRRAWRHARGVRAPLSLALLEIADADRLRAGGQRDRAVARLRSARGRLDALGAAAYLARCDRELAACGVPVQPSQGPATVGLTRAERAVALLVAAGRSNREAAAELYVTVKTVEFHLGHVYAKLGIRSRHELRAQLVDPS